jgi:hypothetical protein
LSVDDVLRQALVNYMAQFIIPDWFQGHNEDRVWTSVYRVHNVPFNQGDRFFRRLLPIDPGLVRAVFVHMNLHYPSFRFGFTCEPSGGVTLSGGMGGWESTGEGLVLLLMTPFVGEEGEDPEASVRRRIGLARTVIVSVLGRASAWRQLTEFSFELDTGNVSGVSPVLEHPGVFDAPALDDAQAIRLVQKVIQGIASLDTATQNRVSLALRWYERALGDHRILRADDTGNVDELIDYWVALETLVGGEGKGVAGALIKLLADIHSSTPRRRVKLFLSAQLTLGARRSCTRDRCTG